MGLVARTAPCRAAEPRFEVPAALQTAVSFWTDVFTAYSRRQVVIHDTERLDRIYSTLDFRDLDERGLSDVQIESTMKRAVEGEKERVRAALLRLHRLGDSHPALTRAELRLRELFRFERDPRKYLRAADQDRIRAQTGLRERFAEGIAVGHRYLPEMERIFRAHGVPVALTRLPLVESCFNVRAYSKAGASGIWQFMPATARRFMRVDDAVDERLDPLASTRAAALYLRENYELLGTWPLAVAAYNHGPGGIARAVRQLGTTDIATIVQRYRGPSFKFASRNFYAEFLAALQVEGRYRDYFGPLELQPPLVADTVQLAHYVPLDTVAACGGSDRATILDLNPSLLPAALDGRQHVPRGFVLRLPPGRREPFERCYAAIPAYQKFDAPKRSYVVHRVRRGQTLGHIAQQYGSSVDQIRRRNGLRKSALIREGQLLRIPAG